MQRGWKRVKAQLPTKGTCGLSASTTKGGDVVCPREQRKVHVICPA